MSREQSDGAMRESLSDKDGTREFERKVAARQSNVLPLDAARSQGRFYGLLA